MSIIFGGIKCCHQNWSLCTFRIGLTDTTIINDIFITKHQLHISWLILSSKKPPRLALVSQPPAMGPRIRPGYSSASKPIFSVLP